MLDADCLEDGETFKNALCIYRCICNYVKDGGNVRAAHCHICSLCRRYTLGPEKYEVTIINVMPLCLKTQRRKTSSKKRRCPIGTQHYSTMGLCCGIVVPLSYGIVLWYLINACMHNFKSQY